MAVLEIILDGSLMIAGGKSAGLGIHLSTLTRRSGRLEVPYIPATALRGAIRLQMEALLRGAELDVACPFPDESLPEGQVFQPKDMVARLFGYAGRPDDRDGSGAGLLRFTDALPLEPVAATARLRIRAGVALDRYSGSAADQHLYFKEECAAGGAIVFQASVTYMGPLAQKEKQWLRAAAESTEAIGAGRSSGGGEIRIRWQEDKPAIKHVIRGDAGTAERARLCLRLLEPAIFGDGQMLGNHRGTRLFPRGSSIRGALAWALIRAGLVPAQHTHEDPGFHALFLENVSFGDGLPVPEPDSEPIIRPATTREARTRQERPFKDVLVRELARERLNRRIEDGGGNRYLGIDDPCYRPDPAPARALDGLVVRTRTRVSLDRYSGSAAFGKLFSFECLDPFFANPNPDRDPVPLSFVSRIENLNPRAARLLEQMGDTTLLIGGGLQHGMGLARIHLEFLQQAPADWERLVKDGQRRIGKLADRLDTEVTRLASNLGIGSQGDSAGDGQPLVLVARSAFITAPNEDHPLARWAEWAGQPVRQFLNRETVGGFNQRYHGDTSRKGPFKTQYQAIGAGSVFVYQVASQNLEKLLRLALPKLRRGVGLNGPCGCGRFELYQEVQQ